MKSLIIALFLAVLVLIFPVYKSQVNKTSANTVEKIETQPFSEDKLFDLIQRWRFDNGLQPYSKSKTLCEIADKRMVEVQTNWEHDGFFKFQREDTVLGENLAKDHTSEQQMLDQWLDSPTHKKNLEDNFTHSCLKCKGNSCVHIFGNIQ